MEFVVAKKNKSRKRKRNTKNKRRVARKLEVKAAARRKIFHHNTSAMRSEPRSHTMEAKTFWENYKVAQEWQQRHSVAWWRSRCHALEHENQILRQKVRSQTFNSGPQFSSRTVKNKREIPTGAESAENCLDSENDDDDDADDEENLEFQVDKDMLNFLEQSIRHKMELKRVRESEMASASDVESPDTPFITGEARIRAKTEDARLLYGDASPRIMAMEAALQATVDRHKDRAKPHYWPNIPLKP